MSEAERLLGDSVRPALPPQPQHPAVWHQVRTRRSVPVFSDEFKLVCVASHLIVPLSCQRGEVSLHGLQDETSLARLQQQAAAGRHLRNHLQERRR